MPTDPPASAPRPTTARPDVAPPLRAPGGTAWVAFDPGRRIGVAWVDAAGELLAHAIVEASQLGELPLPDGAGVLIGDGTGSVELDRALRALGGEPRRVDETGTSLVGRRLYFARNPATGWRRLLPSGLRTPPVPVDDYAAWAIARRHLGIGDREIPGPR